MHDSLVEEVTRRPADHAESLTLGDPFDAEVAMGPVVNRQQHERIGGYLGLGVAEGAELVTGGSLADRPGYFVEPTVFLGRHDQRIAREEIFGPVATIIPFSDTADVLTLANDSHFGLNAIIHTDAAQARPSSAASIPASSSSSRAATFCSRWSMLRVPGISRMCGSRASNHARPT